MSNIRCDYFPACSGCEIQQSVTFPSIYQEIKLFFNSLGGNDVPLFHDLVVHWRTRSKLAVRGSIRCSEIGLFRKGTHEVVSIPLCPLHHIKILDAYAVLKKSIEALEILPYEENGSRGEIRYVQFVVERETGRVQLTLVFNGSSKNVRIESLVKQLYNEGDFLGIWVNYQPMATNRIFGDVWEFFSYLPQHKKYVWEKMGNCRFALHPACFAQAHLPMFDKMLNSIRSSLIPEQKVVELYAGVGAIGFNVAEISQKVVCSEINPFARECFELSRAQLDFILQKRLSFVEGGVKKTAHLIEKAEVLIVDPPRKGLEEFLLKKIVSSSNLKQLIYVSCDFQSFSRDCRFLVENGWKIQKAETYLFFPGKNHLEILCIFNSP